MFSVISIIFCVGAVFGFFNSDETRPTGDRIGEAVYTGVVCAVVGAAILVVVL